jgi:dihydroorotase
VSFFNVTYILQLHSSITPEVIAEAAAAGIAGVKVYPQGTTTDLISTCVQVHQD